MKDANIDAIKRQLLFFLIMCHQTKSLLSAIHFSLQEEKERMKRDSMFYDLSSYLRMRVGVGEERSITTTLILIVTLAHSESLIFSSIIIVFDYDHNILEF
jgi:hypothetical protein